MSFKDKIIAITGGASGIGLATAKILSSRGATVCIADISPTALEAVTTHFKLLSVPFEVTKVDVTKRSEVDNWIEFIVRKFGRLDGAANVAGIIGKHHGLRKLEDQDDDEWNQIMAVNLTGLMYSLRAELRVVPDGASIVNIASVQGVMGFGQHSAYSASKHGVIGLTRCSAKEYGDREIRINCVAPGSIDTPLLNHAFDIVDRTKGVSTEPTAIKRLGTAEEIGNVIAFLLGPESSFVTGAVYGADGGWAC